MNVLDCISKEWKAPLELNCDNAIRQLLFRELQLLEKFSLYCEPEQLPEVAKVMALLAEQML